MRIIIQEIQYVDFKQKIKKQQAKYWKMHHHYYRNTIELKSNLIETVIPFWRRFV